MIELKITVMINFIYNTVENISNRLFIFPVKVHKKYLFGQHTFQKFCVLDYNLIHKILANN